MLGGYLFGALVVLFGVYLFISATKAGKQMDREKFERTNAHGVQEFESYDELVQTRRRGGLTGGKAGIGCVTIIIGAALMLAVYVNHERSSQIAAADEERYYRLCMKAWDKRDGPLEHCRKLCEFPQNRSECKRIFGSADGPKGEYR
ncbi:hypothetical protein [Sphingomonas soli]|uniref:hypothetical protein n=1 Tax=Sphingomonas soli TaxID=266127 RepID=UPI00083314D9|nr:hypothetical protein [Sphingomonas soli]